MTLVVTLTFDAFSVLEIHTVVDTKKLFDVLALIEEGTQISTVDNIETEIPESAALRIDLGHGHSEEVTEHKDGFFPGV